MIELFDIENNKIKPTKHCYTIKALKRIMDEYPEDYKSIYAYLFYMSCINEEMNPFFNVPEVEREELVLEQVGGDFSTDEEAIDSALQVCKKLYETPTYRAYMGIRNYLDKLAQYMGTSEITDGRDGNHAFGLKAAKDFADIRKSYNEVYKELKEEQSTTARGHSQIAYDQM